MALLERSQPHPAGYRDISVADVTLPAHGYRIIDVREPHEFVGELGHVAGSTLVPLSSVMAHAPGWSKDEELLFVCRSGGRSGNAAQALSKLGFSKVMNLVGGMLAWNAAGRPVEK